jgi:hypothetical protein
MLICQSLHGQGNETHDWEQGCTEQVSLSGPSANCLADHSVNSYVVASPGGLMFAFHFFLADLGRHLPDDLRVDDDPRCARFRRPRSRRGFAHSPTRSWPNSGSRDRRSSRSSRTPKRADVARRWPSLRTGLSRRHVHGPYRESRVGTSRNPQAARAFTHAPKARRYVCRARGAPG